MMKIVVALCLIFAVQAAHQSNWYSGSVNATGTPQAAAVNIAVTPCAVLAAPTGYRNFTVNVTVAGFYYFSALYEKTFIPSAQIQVYTTTFDPANACTNLLYAKGSAGSVPHTQFVLYLTPGLYPTVVTGSSADNLGLFAVHVDATTLNGATDPVTSHYWYAPSSNTDCSDSGSVAPYTTFGWTQNGTSAVDILMFGYNSTATTSSWYFNAALYNATNLAFVGTGNFTNPASGCNANFMFQKSVSNSDLSFSSLQNTEAYQGAAALGLTVTNGLSYTIAISTADSTIKSGVFGIFIRPTSLSYLGNLLTWDAPTVPGLSTTTDCTPAGTLKYWQSNWFQAQYNAYIIDNPTGFFDTIGCLYRGLNIGNATAPPANCPGNTSNTVFIQCGDTGDGGPVANFLIPGLNYTWVQTRYGGSSGTAGAPYLLYNYSGKLLGVAPVTTTGTATTGGEGSSSDASSVVMMLTLTIVAMFF